MSVFSDCCGALVSYDVADIEICPRCLEHCDCIVVDDDCAESDIIYGFDDGEAR